MFLYKRERPRIHCPIDVSYNWILDPSRGLLRALWNFAKSRWQLSSEGRVSVKVWAPCAGVTLVTVAAPISYFVLLRILMWQAGDGGSLAPLHSCSILLCDMKTRSKYVAPLLLRCQDADSMSISHLLPIMGDPHNGDGGRKQLIKTKMESLV